jgi:Flp pilus assembly protein TadD
VRDNSGYRVGPNLATIATRLKQSGYATAAFVGAFPLHSRFGLTRGFDVYDDRFGETRAPTEFAMPERPASAVVPLAREWIAGERGQRWLAWVHLFDPHAPYRPPAPYDAQYAGRPYYGEVAAVDSALSPLLDDVQRSTRPTLVVVTADHGEALGDHGEQSHGLFAYESTLRVPLILAELGGARGDGRSSAPAEVSSVPARHVDIVPTILDAVGQGVPTDLPGRSLLLESERRGRPAPRPSYFEAMSAMLTRGWAPLTGVLVDRDKLIELPIPERYDVGADPAEQSNLFGRTPARDRELSAALQSYRAAPPGERVVESPETTAGLRALGYVAGSAAPKARYTDADDPKRLVDLDSAVHAAVEAFSRGRVGDAIEMYQQVINRRPDMAIAYRHLAFLEWQRGNASGAVYVLRRAITAGVRQPAILTDLGTYLAESGRGPQAIELLEPLAQNPAADADLLNTLGIAYARVGRADDARRTFERVLAINPESSVPIENLGMLALEHNDAAAARQLFDRAVQIDPRSSRAHAGVAAAALRGGDTATAIAEWTRAVQLDATNFDALYNLGATLARTGDMARARPYLEQFVRRAPPGVYANDIRDIGRLLQRK